MDGLVAGSYERFLFGIRCAGDATLSEAKPTLARSFTYAAHKVACLSGASQHILGLQTIRQNMQGPVKCVASCGPFLASGGADDLVHIYDTQAGTDLGFLMSPGDGAVSALAFHRPAGAAEPTHLLSGAADGGVSVWQVNPDWVCLRTLHSHRKEVTSISVHASGRLALTASRDGTLKLWNLVRGKCVHTRTLPAVAEQVAFSPSGSAYALLFGLQVCVHGVGGGVEAARTLQHATRALCLQWLSDTSIAVGCEGGMLSLWDIGASLAAPEVVSIAGAHRSRIRAISLAGLSTAPAHTYLATASSDGSVRLWDLQSLEMDGPAPEPVAEVRTDARLTCLCTLDGGSAANAGGKPGKRKRRQDAAGPAGKQQRRGEEEVPTGVGVLLPAKQIKRKSGHSAAEVVALKQGAKARVEPLKQRPRKRVQNEAQERAEKPTAADGSIVHDGVVDFPDTPSKRNQKKRRKKKHMAVK